MPRPILTVTVTATVVCALAVLASPAHAQERLRNIQNYTVITYNMQGKPVTHVDTFLIDHDIVAIQEAKKNNDPPSGTVPCTDAQTGMPTAPVRYFNRTTAGRDRHRYQLYYFPQAGGNNAKNLAIATKVVPNDCKIIPKGWMSKPAAGGHAARTIRRDVVGLRFGTNNTWFWTIHANSSNLATWNVKRALKRVRTASTGGGPWALLGDTNINLITHPAPGIGLQGTETRYDTRAATQIHGGNLDWMVASLTIPGYTARRCRPSSGSDHYPVELTTGGRTTSCIEPS